MSGVPLGLARRAIDIVRTIADDKLIVPELVMMKDVVRVQLAVAEAETTLGAARAYAYDCLDRLWDTVVGRQRSVRRASRLQSSCRVRTRSEPRVR